MSRITAITFTLLLSLVMQAQSTVSFVCVPVKGSKADFVKNIVSKGCYITESGEVKVVLNGDTCTVTVNTVNDTVASVTAIEDKAFKDENAAANRYNTLLEYYKKNREYTEYEHNNLTYLQDPETIRRYIQDGGYYYAEFFQITERSMQEFSRRLTITLVDMPDGYHIERRYDTTNDIVMLDKNIGTTTNK